MIPETQRMSRHIFSRQTIDRLSKRAGMKCSYPSCRLPTVGPDAEEGATNLGVAAHITAAAPGGPRYDEAISEEDRKAISNGIWLCQNHAKLIDDDEIEYTVGMLRDWKETAERMAWLEARGFAVSHKAQFGSLLRKIPNLISEIRADLSGTPLTRQFILMSKMHIYNSGSTPFFTYYYEDHDELDSKITIMVHSRACYDISFNQVPRYNFTEEFVDFIQEHAS
jgi:hypothetical protein